MANQYAAPVTATQVGSYFVQQYYQVFQQQRDSVHQFYNDTSSMIRVDGEMSHSASDMMNIHQLITAQNFAGIEIKTINSLQSWNGGVLVVVSGSVNARGCSGWRKFVQTFFLAPQEKGYFVLNDMFHFVDEEVEHQPSAPAAQELNVDYQPTISNHRPNLPVYDYTIEEEARNYVNSVHIGGDEPIQEYNYHEHYQPQPELGTEPELEPQLDAEFEAEAEAEPNRLEEGTTFEESSAPLQSPVATLQEPQPSTDGAPQKLTYASILRAKGKSQSTVSSPPAFTQSKPPASDWDHVPQPSMQQFSPTLPISGMNTMEETFSVEEIKGESTSVYVRNLPSSVTSLDILQEFKCFGRIKSDGVFLRNRKDAGICYAFVEFEDVQSVQNAIKASPIQLAGRQVYIEERRPNTGASRGGRSGGRGRGGRGGRSSGRGEQYAIDNRLRSNGFRGN